jgi:streptomycin 6-kinase
MLKLTPDGRLAAAEARALRSWAPSGRVPGVWGYDPAVGALLLEAIADETPLSERPQVTLGLDQVAEFVGALHAKGDPAAADGESLADRVEFIFAHWIGRHAGNPAVTRMVPMERLERGRALARDLAAGGPAPVLLHGDLHPGNVLDGGATRGLVAIDPRPCVGDAAVDAVDWVFWTADDPRRWRPRCRDLAGALGLDAERLWGWCGAFAAMLAASTAASGGPADRVAAVLALAP